MSPQPGKVILTLNYFITSLKAYIAVIAPSVWTASLDIWFNFQVVLCGVRSLLDLCMATPPASCCSQGLTKGMKRDAGGVNSALFGDR